MQVTTAEGLELAAASDEELLEDADGMMARWTDYSIDMNDEWHTAMVTELTVRGLTAKAAELCHHRWVQEHWTEGGPLDV